MNQTAKLASLEGWAVLEKETTEHGESLYTGLWEPQDPDESLEELHTLYMARERITYEGPVEGDDNDHAENRQLEVIILEWSNEEHPSSIKVQEAVRRPDIDGE